MGANSLESSKLHPADGPATTDDELGNGTDKCLYATFAFNDYKLLVSIGLETALDTGSDQYQVFQTFFWKTI